MLLYKGSNLPPSGTWVVVSLFLNIIVAQGATAEEAIIHARELGIVDPTVSRIFHPLCEATGAQRV